MTATPFRNDAEVLNYRRQAAHIGQCHSLVSLHLVTCKPAVSSVLEEIRGTYQVSSSGVERTIRKRWGLND